MKLLNNMFYWSPRSTDLLISLLEATATVFYLFYIMEATDGSFCVDRKN